MSRNPVSLLTMKGCDAEDCVNFITRHVMPIAMTSQEILCEINKDSIMTKLKSIIANETWNKISEVSFQKGERRAYSDGRWVHFEWNKISTSKHT